MWDSFFNVLLDNISQTCLESIKTLGTKEPIVLMVKRRSPLWLLGTCWSSFVINKISLGVVCRCLSELAMERFLVPTWIDISLFHWCWSCWQSNLCVYFHYQENGIHFRNLDKVNMMPYMLIDWISIVELIVTFWWINDILSCPWIMSIWRCFIYWQSSMLCKPCVRDLQ